MPSAPKDEIRGFILSTIVNDMNHPIDPAELTDESPLGTGGIDLDSLSLIELTMRLERRFNVEFPETSIEPLAGLKLGELVTDVLGRGATV